MKRAHHSCILLGACVALGLSIPTADAGDRQLEVLLVDMTPDESPSKECVKQIRKVIAEDYSEIQKMGETKLRKMAGKPTKGESFIDWPTDVIMKMRKADESYVDTFVLVDCRPDKKQVDILVVPSSNGVARLSLRQLTIDKAVMKWLGAAVLRRAWNGFSP